MADPREGLEQDGTIRTGASVHRIPERFRPVLTAAVSAIGAAAPNASVYAYGSVTTGQATSPYSDVDLLAIGLDAATASHIAAMQSARVRDLCRGVEVAAASASDFDGESDEAYGGRVFLHHYCVHLAGLDLDRARAAFPGDRRAARGFNGDIDRHMRRWRREADIEDPVELGRRMARKTLLAVAGLVSVHDTTWTTDRQPAARRWSEVQPELEPGLERLLTWSSGTRSADRDVLQLELDSVVGPVARQFAGNIGLWPADPT